MMMPESTYFDQEEALMRISDAHAKWQTLKRTPRDQVARASLFVLYLAAHRAVTLVTLPKPSLTAPACVATRVGKFTTPYWMYLQRC